MNLKIKITLVALAIVAVTCIIMVPMDSSDGVDNETNCTHDGVFASNTLKVTPFVNIFVTGSDRGSDYALDTSNQEYPGIVLSTTGNMAINKDVASSMEKDNNNPRTICVKATCHCGVTCYGEITFELCDHSNIFIEEDPISIIIGETKDIGGPDSIGWGYCLGAEYSSEWGISIAWKSMTVTSTDSKFVYIAAHCVCESIVERKVLIYSCNHSELFIDPTAKVLCGTPYNVAPAGITGAQYSVKPDDRYNMDENGKITFNTVGEYTIKITAKHCGKTESREMTFNVGCECELTLDALTSGTVGHMYSHDLGAGYSVTGLPMGLDYNADTGLISGTPREIFDGNISVKTTCENGKPIECQMTLKISAAPPIDEGEDAPDGSIGSIVSPPKNGCTIRPI